ncbi:hypothetical protein QR680_000492 [Steinernema hermaphroditum]|uniref:SREBP regulating gene protein n=1 Tax=Steinernema hermaphroditum TaxID=289476 RepID=A0AA39LED7_9BILA|nr:hypothetical protein QR680_000492 [Steinernema hermaphroditum]
MSMMLMTVLLVLLAPLTAQCKYDRVCGRNLTNLSVELCTYPGMSHPCYRPFHIQDVTMSRRDFMGDICCRRHCSKKFLKSFCCFEQSCLESCYEEFRPRNFKFNDDSLEYDDNDPMIDKLALSLLLILVAVVSGANDSEITVTTTTQATQNTTEERKVRVCDKTAQFALFNLCQYPGEDSPCFTYDSPIFIKSLLHKVARACCSEKCTWKVFRSHCCFYNSCLNECYGYNLPNPLGDMIRPDRLFYYQRKNMTNIEIENFLFDPNRREVRKRNRRDFKQSLDF